MTKSDSVSTKVFKGMNLSRKKVSLREPYLKTLPGNNLDAMGIALPSHAKRLMLDCLTNSAGWA